jgi:hypothetical protein
VTLAKGTPYGSILSIFPPATPLIDVQLSSARRQSNLLSQPPTGCCTNAWVNTFFSRSAPIPFGDGSFLKSLVCASCVPVAWGVAVSRHICCSVASPSWHDAHDGSPIRVVRDGDKTSGAIQCAMRYNEWCHSTSALQHNECAATQRVRCNTTSALQHNEWYDTTSGMIQRAV